MHRVSEIKGNEMVHTENLRESGINNEKKEPQVCEMHSTYKSKISIYEMPFNSRVDQQNSILG